jgi:hypothetical protein
MVTLENGKRVARIFLEKMRRRNLTEYEKELIFEMWQDRTPTKVIAIELGVSYACIYFHLKKRNLVG